MKRTGTKPRGRATLAKAVPVILLLGLLVALRHPVVEAIRGLSFLPGAVDRVENAAARVRPLLEVELAAMGLKLGDPLFLRVLKEEQVLEVWMGPAGERDYVHYKTYVLCRPGGEPGPRSDDRDLQLPEGFYGVRQHGLRPYHRHYLAFEIDYPNELDRYFRRPGRNVLVQGDCVGMGSLALSNPVMEELYTLAAAALQAGQDSMPVHLFPFQLTDARMNEVLASDSPLLEFWGNLKEGYDFFEIVRRPPRVTIKAGRYGFE